MIGILGGTFDPIHFGHIGLALHVLEHCGLDEVVLVPAGLPPFKQENGPKAAKENRLAMCEIAVRGVKGLSVSDYEVKKDEVSYTIDTVKYFISTRGEAVRLILGEDLIQDFTKWKSAKELLQLAPPIVGKRGASTASKVLILDNILVDVVPVPVLEISSTNLRERLKKRAYSSHLMPREVVDYIEQKRLY